MQAVLLPDCTTCTCCFSLPACSQSRVHHKTRTPVVSVLFCGAVSAVLALFVPLEELSDLTSMGALFAFCVVSAGVLFRWGAVTALLSLMWLMWRTCCPYAGAPPPTTVS